MRRWRLVDTGVASGAWNMAVDETLIRGLAAGEQTPVLRFFGWHPPAISFGYNQQPANEVDLEKCRQARIDLVRRLTGGRAVLHWQELTYSVLCRQDDAQLGGSIETAYRRIGECLIEGLRCFGVEATLERASSRTVRPQGTEVALPCFSSTARWEVTCQGRKLIGSAQRRLDGVMLQHGSLLTGPAHGRLLEFLRPLPEPLRRNWRAQLENHSIHLQACTDKAIDVPRLVSCLTAGFEECLAVRLHAESLSSAEQRCAHQLVDERYGNPHWMPGPRRPQRLETACLPTRPAAWES